MRGQHDVSGIWSGDVGKGETLNIIGPFQLEKTKK